MLENEVLEQAFAMPLTNPAYSPGPYRFVNREYLIITYRTDPARLRAIVPEPLDINEREAASARSCTTVCNQADRRCASTKWLWRVDARLMVAATENGILVMRAVRRDDLRRSLNDSQPGHD